MLQKTADDDLERLSDVIYLAFSAAASDNSLIPEGSTLSFEDAMQMIDACDVEEIQWHCDLGSFSTADLRALLPMAKAQVASMLALESDPNAMHTVEERATSENRARAEIIVNELESALRKTVLADKLLMDPQLVRALPEELREMIFAHATSRWAADQLNMPSLTSPQKLLHESVLCERDDVMLPLLEHVRELHPSPSETPWYGSILLSRLSTLR